MFASVGKPLLSSDHMCNFHFPVVNHIRKMKSWPSIFFDNDKVIKFNKVYWAIILVNKKWRCLENISFNSDCIRLSFENTLFNLLHGKLWTLSVIRTSRKIIILVLFVSLLILIWFLFSFFLSLGIRLYFSLMSTKARICKIIF